MITGKVTELASTIIGEVETHLVLVGIGIASDAGAPSPQIGTRYRRTSGHQIPLWSIVIDRATQAAVFHQQGIRWQYPILQGFGFARKRATDYLLDLQH